FSLRYFAGDSPKGHVWTIDKDTGEMWSAPPENTAVIRHFYSIERDDGTHDPALEEALGKIESVAAPIYERMVSGELPAGQEKADFASFVALAYLRTEAMRRDAAEVIGRGAQIMNYAYGKHIPSFNRAVEALEKERGRALEPDEKEKLRG